MNMRSKDFFISWKEVKELALTKARKQALTAQYVELLKSSQGIVLTSFSGAPVRELEALRRKVRESGGEFLVVKNSLLEWALKDAGLEAMPAALEGTTAVGFATDDVLGVAKALVEAARASENLMIKGGMVAGSVYQAPAIEMLADLPPLPVVQARLMAQIQAPATRVAGALASSVRQLATVVKAYSELEPAVA